MRKIIIRKPGGIDAMELVTEPDPLPGPGEVSIRAHAMAVGWPDILIRTGVYKWMPPLPVTLGNELTGVIEKVGAGVSGLAPGQPVYLGSRELNFQSGCYTDLKVAPARAVLPLPDNVDLDQAAGLGYCLPLLVSLAVGRPQLDQAAISHGLASYIDYLIGVVAIIDAEETARERLELELLGKAIVAGELLNDGAVGGTRTSGIDALATGSVDQAVPGWGRDAPAADGCRGGRGAGLRRARAGRSSHRATTPPRHFIQGINIRSVINSGNLLISILLLG